MIAIEMKEEKKSEFEELIQKAGKALAKKDETIDNADKRKHLTEAIEYFEKAIECCPDDGIEMRFILKIRFILEKKEKAEKELNYLKANFT